ncbi:MAG: hypothetical protein ACE5G1_08155 [bacterium]
MINLVVALIHEARPLIDHFHMKKQIGRPPYTIYTNGEFNIIISGIGKLLAAAATAYLQASSSADLTAWLNLGIAGHSQLEIGQGFIAHKVVDQATLDCYYPPLVFPFPCPTSDLETVDQPSSRFEKNRGYDMEVSGYYKIALRTSTTELIHCYKVVSDNRVQRLEKISKDLVIRLISDRMNEIESILTMLSTEVKRHRRFHSSSSDFDEITRQWHFTETQKAQLARLLQRWHTMYGKRLLTQINLASYTNGKTLLEDLQKQLVSQAIVF